MFIHNLRLNPFQLKYEKDSRHFNYSEGQLYTHIVGNILLKNVLCLKIVLTHSVP